jgi:hypothetical protein
MTFKQFIAREILFGPVPRAYGIWETYQNVFGVKKGGA